MDPDSELELSPEEIRKFIIDSRARERMLRTFSFVEEKLWNLAEAAPFGAKVIPTNSDGLADPYLLRVYLGPDRAAVAATAVKWGLPSWMATVVLKAHRPFLHYFFRGDNDRAFHNHPFTKSYSAILAGGYFDHRWDFTRRQVNTRFVGPGQLNTIRRGDYHKVELLPTKNCWTLFFAGERVQKSDGKDWEFYDPETDTYTPWGEWTSKASRKAAAKMETVLTPQVYDGHAEDPDAGHGGYNWSTLGR